MTVQVPLAGYQRLDAARVCRRSNVSSVGLRPGFPNVGCVESLQSSSRWLAGDGFGILATPAAAARSFVSRSVSVLIVVATFVALLLTLTDAVTNDPARSFEWLSLIETTINDIVFVAIAVYLIDALPNRLERGGSGGSERDEPANCRGGAEIG